jgi:hypothetical protein
MNTLDRLLTVTAIVAVSAATLPGLWPLLNPEADLWKAPANVRRIHRLFDEADKLENRHVLLRRMRGAREQVIEALIQGRFTASQAVDRFRELDEICSESGLPPAPERKHKSPSEVARMEVLGWLRPALETAPAVCGRAALERVVTELSGPSERSLQPGRIH